MNRVSFFCKWLIVAIQLCWGAFFSYAQMPALNTAVDAKLVSGDYDEFDYDSEYTYGINFNTNAGLIGGLYGKYTKKISDRWYHHFGLEIVHFKNPKEERVVSNVTQNDFIPYKMNYAVVLRPHYGREYVLFKKGPEDGVHVNFISSAGLSMAVLKPYHILYGPNSVETARSVPYDPAIHRQNMRFIYGAGSLFDGFDNLSVQMGASAKAALDFEFGQFNSSVIGVETGAVVDAFASKLPIMDLAPNRSFFTSVYITLYYGKKQ